MIAKGDALVVDVRDAPEVEKSGKVAGAVQRLARHAGIPRRSQSSPTTTRISRRTRRIILYCASGGRARALSGKTLNDMGYGEGLSTLGAFKDWVEAAALTGHVDSGVIDSSATGLMISSRVARARDDLNVACQRAASI